MPSSAPSLQALFPQLDIGRINDPNYMLQFSNPDEGSGDRYLLRGADGQMYGLGSTLGSDPADGGSINVTHHTAMGNNGGGEYYEFGRDGNPLMARDYKNDPNGMRDFIGMGAMMLGPLVGGGMFGPLGDGAGAGASLGTNGAFLGEGAASGIGAWDGAMSAAQAGGIGAAGTGAMGASGASPYTFSPAMDSQAANAAMGSDALGGYTGAASTFGAPAADAAGPAAAPGGFSMAGTLKALAPQLIAGGASLIGGAMNAGAAKDAAGIQAGAAQAGIDETRRQFDTMTGLLQPYVDAGRRGLAGYEGLAGTMGAPAQQQAITDLQGTPMWGSTVKAGEDAILQNVAATGGLRGGNTQDALAKFRAGLLTDQVNQQLARYGSLATMGQNSAARVGTAGMSSADSIAKLLQQQGSANAGGVLAGNNAIVNTIGGLGGLYAANGSSLPSMTASGMQAGLSQTGVGSSGFGSGMAYGNQDLGQYF